MSFDDFIDGKLDDDKPQEIAALDLGSNSFHLIIARIVNDSLQIIGRVKQRVHLADGLDKNDHLNEEAIERGLSCLALFAERLQGFSADNVRIVATHTLRQAVNSEEFLQRAADIIPYPIEIISGQEEARLIYMGVAHTQPEEGQKLAIDIGGGSTELVIGKGFEPILAESRRMGCVSYTQQFFPTHEISKRSFTKAQVAAELELESLSWQYRNKGWEFAFGASGSIKAAQGVLVEMGKKDGVITAKRLQLLVDAVLQFKDFDSLDLPGLAPDRRDVFVAGLAILCALFRSLDIKELRLSNGALREGVLYEMENNRFRYHDIRSRTATSLAEHYKIDREQAERVLITTLALYEQWKEQNPELVEPQLEPLLRWAAQLYEVGLSINNNNLQRHSAYILQNSNLPGFNQENQLILSSLVRFCRKSVKLDEIPAFNLIKRRQFLPLLQILRLAILLNNQRQATTLIGSLQLTSDGYHITLTFPTGYLEQNSLIQADLEREQEYWQDVTGWELSLNGVDSEEPPPDDGH